MSNRQSTRSRSRGRHQSDKDNSKIIIGLSAVGLIAVLIFLFMPTKSKHSLDSVEERVTGVIQGNVIQLASGLKVQLLGVGNTQKARDFLMSEVVKKTVRLIPDSKDATPYYETVDETVRAYVKIVERCSYSNLNGALLLGHYANFDNSFCNDSAAVFQAYASDNDSIRINPGPGPDPDSDPYLTLLSKVELNKLMSRASMLITVGSESLGTAFFINSDGLALTNVHVIRNISDRQGSNVNVYITDDKGEISPNRYRPFGRIVTADLDNDFAVFTVKLDAGEKVPYLNLVRKRPETGTDVAAFGHTLGQLGTFTVGNVSALRQNMLQISAPMDQGNSGGPVCDFYGRVVGIAQSILVDPSTGEKNRANVNYAVDIQVVRALLDKTEDVKTYGGK